MKKLFAIIVVMSIWMSAIAQDYQLSMFTSSPLALNPAATGFFKNGNWRLHLNHREQWGSFLNKAINTSALSFDMPIPSKKIGVGLLVLGNTTGNPGGINDMTVAASFGYTTKLSRRGGHHLAFGLQAGIKQKSFQLDEATFDDMYVPGVGFDPVASPTSETISNESVLYPDFSAGALWFIEDHKANFLPWVGVAAYHLSEPEESFTGTLASPLPRKYVIHVGADIFASDQIGFTPMLFAQMQGDHTQTNMGATFNYTQNDATTFRIGGYLRSDDAFMAMIGINFTDYTFMFDYEINTSSLKSVSDNNGGFNVTVRYVRVKDKRYNVKFL